MTPYLVQRVNRRDRVREDMKGINRHFTFDYMGSAEFEYGRLGEATRRMREHLVDLQILKLEHGHSEAKALWFLGDPRYLVQATDFVKDQLGPMKHRLQDVSRIRQSLVEPTTTLRRLATKHDAWWALDTGTTLSVPSLHRDDRPWLVFVQKADAQRWMKDLANPEEPK